jgi:hypothetical protein
VGAIDEASGAAGFAGACAPPLTANDASDAPVPSSMLRRLILREFICTPFLLVFSSAFRISTDSERSRSFVLLGETADGTLEWVNEDRESFKPAGV